MKKKLIFITEALWIGGIETALVNLLNHLDYDKYEVTCLILRDSQELAGRITPKCRLIVSDRQHPVSFSKAYTRKRMYNLMEEPQNASRVRRLIWRALCLLLRAPEARCYASYLKKQLASEHFDTAVIYSDRAAEAAVRAVSASRFLMFYHHGAMRRSYHDEYGYRRAEKVVVVSDSLADRLRKFRSRYADKIISINNLIDTDGVRRKSLEAPETVFPKDYFHIVSCGRLSYEKGMDIAIDACARLVAAGICNIRWWIVGGGPEESHLREQIARLGLDGYVRLLGMQKNPYPYLRQADLYVQPSRFEGHCVTVLEARLLAVPILATRTAAEEQIDNGRNGMLCDADADSVADSVKYLQKSPQILKQYREELARHSFEDDNKAILKKLYELL